MRLLLLAVAALFAESMLPLLPMLIVVVVVRQFN